MASFETTIEHNGQTLDVEVSWDSILNGIDEGTGIDGLCFTVKFVGDREATPDEVERIGEELDDRYDKDNAFMEKISKGIDDHEHDDYFPSEWD